MKKVLKAIWYKIRRPLVIAVFLVLFYAFAVVPILMVLFKHAQIEVHTCLMAINKAEFAYFSEHSMWSDSFSKIAWSPTDPANYTYFLSPTEYVGKTPEELGLSLPVDFSYFDVPAPGKYEIGFIAVAIGNVDLDDELDVWWIDKDNIPEHVWDDVDYRSTLVNLTMKLMGLD